MQKSKSNPARTYTLSDFVDIGRQDELTYGNFSTLFQKSDTFSYSDQNILDYYIDELKSICKKVTKLTTEDIAKYKYSPDLLAYDLYGSTQLDFILLLCNGIIDPKEFDFKNSYLLVPPYEDLYNLLSSIYNAENTWLTENK